MADHEDVRSPRFTYDRGVLEITVPGNVHEGLADLVRAMMSVIAETRELDMTGLGSTTFKDAGWDRGFEPDACFDLENAERIRGLRRVVPRVDPPPEIVFEVDITSSSIDKMALYARFGVRRCGATTVPSRRSTSSPTRPTSGPTQCRGARTRRRDPHRPALRRAGLPAPPLARPGAGVGRRHPPGLSLPGGLVVPPSLGILPPPS